MNRIKSFITMVILTAACCFCMIGCGIDDIDISGYADQQIAIDGISEETVYVTIAELKDMECITIKTESTSDKIGEVRATGPTLETVLSSNGTSIDNVRKITFYGDDGYSYSLNEDYIAEHEIILAFGIDGEPLDKESAPCRIIIPESDSAYWIRLLSRIEIEMK